MDADQLLVRKIISGGQTGVEMAALDVAAKLGLGHGGWTPRGMRNEAGQLPERLGLVEVSRVGFQAAMEQNIIHSDGTLLITRGQKTTEARFAVETALRHERQFLHADLSQQSSFEAASLASSWLSMQKIREVFITGPSASQDSRLYHQTKKIIETAFYLGFVKTGLHPEVGIPQPTETRSAKGALPQSVSEAVEQLKKVLPLKDRAIMANMQSSELEQLRNGLGEYVKQNFGLYAGNPMLMESCMHHGMLNQPLPDEACAVILRALWNDLQTTHKLRIVR